MHHALQIKQESSSEGLTTSETSRAENDHNKYMFLCGSRGKPPQKTVFLLRFARKNAHKKCTNVLGKWGFPRRGVSHHLCVGFSDPKNAQTCLETGGCETQTCLETGGSHVCWRFRADFFAQPTTSPCPGAQSKKLATKCFTPPTRIPSRARET